MKSASDDDHWNPPLFIPSLQSDTEVPRSHLTREKKSLDPWTIEETCQSTAWLAIDDMKVCYSSNQSRLEWVTREAWLVCINMPLIAYCLTQTIARIVGETCENLFNTRLLANLFNQRDSVKVNRQGVVCIDQPTGSLKNDKISRFRARSWWSWSWNMSWSWHDKI